MTPGARIRKICMAFPEAEEKPFGGHSSPAYRVRDKLFVMTSAFAPDDLTPVKAADVKARKPYPVSMMPPGLINPLNRDELLDLFAYLLSGGNPSDTVFAK